MEIGHGNEKDFVFSYDGLQMIKSTIARIIADIMAGNIKIETAKEAKIEFNGNQAINKKSTKG